MDGKDVNKLYKNAFPIEMLPYIETIVNLYRRLRQKLFLLLPDMIMAEAVLLEVQEMNLSLRSRLGKFKN